MGPQNTKNPKKNAKTGGGGVKKWKSRPLYQTQSEVYDKVKWVATSEGVKLANWAFLHHAKKPINGIYIYSISKYFYVSATTKIQYRSRSSYFIPLLWLVGYLIENMVSYTYLHSILILKRIFNIRRHLFIFIKSCNLRFENKKKLLIFSSFISFFYPFVFCFICNYKCPTNNKSSRTIFSICFNTSYFLSISGTDIYHIYILYS